VIWGWFLIGGVCWFVWCCLLFVGVCFVCLILSVDFYVFVFALFVICLFLILLQGLICFDFVGWFIWLVDLVSVLFCLFVA